MVGFISVLFLEFLILKPSRKYEAVLSQWEIAVISASILSILSGSSTTQS